MKNQQLIKKIKWIIFMLFTALMIPAAGFCADVDVFGEGVVIGEELHVYIYADVNVDQLVSFGVSVNYDPAELAPVNAQKDLTPVPYTSNTTKWYIGDSSADYKNSPLPDTSVSGQVIFIGGKLDPANPELGVSVGEKVFLGKVTFGPATVELPSDPMIYLSYAKGDGSSTYKNFVRINNGTPEVLDGAGVYFGPVDVFAQGDADGNGVVTPRDIIETKANIGNADSPCYKDCDGNGSITPRDIICVKSKI